MAEGGALCGELLGKLAVGHNGSEMSREDVGESSLVVVEHDRPAPIVEQPVLVDAWRCVVGDRSTLTIGRPR